MRPRSKKRRGSKNSARDEIQDGGKVSNKGRGVKKSKEREGDMEAVENEDDSEQVKNEKVICEDGGVGGDKGRGSARASALGAPHAHAGLESAESGSATMQQQLDRLPEADHCRSTDWIPGSAPRLQIGSQDHCSFMADIELLFGLKSGNSQRCGAGGEAGAGIGARVGGALGEKMGVKRGRGRPRKDKEGGGEGGGIAVKRKRGKVAKSVDLAVERIDFVALSEEEGQDGASEGAGDQDGGEREDKGRNDAGGEESAAAAVAVTAVSRRVGGLVESDTESEGAEKEDEEQHQGVTAVNIDAGADTESDNEEDVVVSPKQVVMSAMAYPVPSANGMSMAQMTRSSSNSAGDASPLAADGVAVGKDGSNGQTGAIEVVATALAGGGVASASTAMHGMGLGDSSILGLDASSSSAVPGLTFGTGNNSMSMSLGGQSYASQLQHTQQSQQQQQQQQLQLLQQLQQQMQQM